ncbi:MAG: nickel pincer cofactor biosynthesis protein LarB [Planctomycetota bacterium]
MDDIDLDFQRQERIGMPELIYGEGKSREQIQRILQLHHERGHNCLVTRLQADKAAGLPGHYDAVARTLTWMQREPEPVPGLVGLVFAGTSDLPVAAEAERTLELFGVRSQRFGDCGVAGVHRLLAHRERFLRCSCLIAFAGFEGALPTVLAGLVPLPVIAVPTSIGYGVSTGGRTALNTMLASCAGGLTVVNIDNGCGAAMAAKRILFAARHEEDDRVPAVD